MELLVLSFVILVLSGLCALFSRRFSFLSASCGPIGAVAASLCGLAAAIPALSSAPQTLALPWSLPGASFSLKLDQLSAFFLLPLFALCICAAVYSLRYVDKRRSESFFLFNLLAASMALVLTASNAVLFLVAWEVMTLVSFLFVVWDGADGESRQAGWTYLVATHIGTAFLLILFTLAWSRAGSAEFDAFPKAFQTLPFGAVAALAVLGFGTKAGFFPLHVWLPKAHPAAPSHISALMSGIMIKTGLYGILRMLTFCPPVPQWFGWLLIGIGIVSGVLGILLALGQHDIKKFLAYSSVENMGVIALGFGLGYAAQAQGRADIALLAFAGAFLHVLNHSLFKGLLFMAAGSVAHATGTRDMEKLGGLLRLMPVTGTCFLAGAAAISALPPFNGFISELLIYLGAFKSLPGSGPNALAGLAALTALAIIGALAAACFARAFGTAFLGLPRSAAAEHAHESPRQMTIPLVLLALLCLGIGALPSFFGRPAFTAAAALLNIQTQVPLPAMLFSAGWAGLSLAAVALALWLGRNLLFSGKKISSMPTWGCGYAAPTPRMQYTASSFAQPLLSAFGLNLKVKLEPVSGLFPRQAGFRSDAQDMARTRIYKPLFELVEDKLGLLRKIQHGSIHAYILYIAVALAFALGWALL
ncbi:MAG: hypothetical protein GX410_06360 [Elusimicrobia bacterium]|nr:hypothetical protein [Elusimicrobiota bacterium]